MSPHYFWLLQQSKEFLKGYDDACALLNRDKNQCDEYLRGYDKAQSDNERRDYA